MLFIFIDTKKNCVILVLIDRIQFSEAKLYLRRQRWINHMEIDMKSSSNIIFAEENAIVLSGNERVGHVKIAGYLQDRGKVARFNRVTSFAQINSTVLIVVDSLNNCLRSIDRQTLQTGNFACECKSSRSSFSRPSSVLLDVKQNSLLVCDRDFHRVVSVNLQDLSMKIVLTKGLWFPSGMAMDSARNLFITNRNFIYQYNRSKKVGNKVAGLLISGLRNSNFTHALFHRPLELVFVTDHLLLIADQYNHVIRVMEFGPFGRSILWSIESCPLNQATSLLLSGNNLYIEDKSTIKVVACKTIYAFSAHINLL